MTPMTAGMIVAAFLRPIDRLRVEASEARNLAYCVASSGVRLSSLPPPSLSSIRQS